jgi:hypothetical protein
MPRRRSSLPPEILEAALAGLEAQHERVQEQIANIHSMLGQSVLRPLVRMVPTIVRRTTSSVAKPKSARKRTMSAAARRRIAEAQKRRWAEFRRKQGAAKR